MCINKINKILIVFLALYLQFAYAAFRINQPVSGGILLCIAIILFNIPDNKGIIIPRQMINLLIWLVIVFCEGLLVAPIIIGHEPNILRIGYEAVSFLFLLIYMTAAYLLAEKKLGVYLIRTMTYMGVLNASLALISEITQSMMLKNIFYMDGVRFQGISVNPNDYLLQTLIAIVYFLNSSKEKWYVRFTGLCCLFFSVLASGSKGGIFVVGIYFFIWISNHVVVRIRQQKEKILLRLLLPLTIVVMLIIAFYIRKEISQLLLLIKIPGVKRIAELIADPLGSLDADGSSRLTVWIKTIRVWQLSPYIGVGLGGHEQILNFIGDMSAETPPHCIYLELLEQTGIIGFVFVAFVLYRFFRRVNVSTEYNLILRESLVILLLQGIFFASDWFATFWVIIGLMLYHQENASRICLRVNRYS